MEDLSTNHGYLTIDRKWTQGDEINLALEMPVEMVASDPRVKTNTGKRAVQRGPLVYCAEETDNGEYDWHSISLKNDTHFDLQPCEGILKDITAISYKSGEDIITMIPYYAWDNRDAGRMKVWLDYWQ
jgi:DUF1680 family protein